MLRRRWTTNATSPISTRRLTAIVIESMARLYTCGLLRHAPRLGKRKRRAGEAVLYGSQVSAKAVIFLDPSTLTDDEIADRLIAFVDEHAPLPDGDEGEQPAEPGFGDEPPTN